MIYFCIQREKKKKTLKLNKTNKQLNTIQIDREILFGVENKNSGIGPYVSSFVGNADTIVKVRVPKAPGGDAHILAVVLADRDVHDDLVAGH